MSTLDGLRSDGRCRLNFDVDGVQITHLFAHVDSDTIMRAVEFPAECRVVLDLGDRSAGGVAVFLRAAELARLIDVLNAAYTRVARRPHADAPSIPRDVPAGQLLDIRVPPGLTAIDVEDRAEALAVCLEVRDVRVKRDPDNAARSSVTVVRRDPLAAMGALAWPLAEAERASLWEPFTVAVDEDGQPVTVRLPERNVIFGGEPGAGKSVAQSLPVAAAALDPTVDLYLFDGNQVEFAPWGACATRTVGPEMGQAVEVLGELGVEMDARYAVLLGEGRRKIAPGDGMRLIVIAVNELAYYTATGDRKQRTEFADRLRDLVARGRAAGIIVLAATQRPSSDVVPTSLRDLFGFRWALRCSTPDASDTILARGWATNGVAATDVPAEARGVGYLLAEGGQPMRCKAYYLDDDTIHAIAARGAVLRGRRPGPHGLAA